MCIRRQHCPNGGSKQDSTTWYSLAKHRGHWHTCLVKTGTKLRAHLMSSISAVQILSACGLCEEANHSCLNTMFAGRRNFPAINGSTSLYRRRFGFDKGTSCNQAPGMSTRSGRRQPYRKVLRIVELCGIRADTAAVGSVSGTSAGRLTRELGNGRCDDAHCKASIRRDAKSQMNDICALLDPISVPVVQYE